VNGLIVAMFRYPNATRRLRAAPQCAKLIHTSRMLRSHLTDFTNALTRGTDDLFERLVSEKILCLLPRERKTFEVGPTIFLTMPRQISMMRATSFV
jgi:hypothetical protein